MRNSILGWLCLLVAFASAQSARSAEEHFTRPKALDAPVRFWTRVYTEVDTKSGFIHDSERLDIVYETIREEDPRARRRAVDAAVARYKTILGKLGKGVRDGLSREEQRVLTLFPEGTSNAEFRNAAERLRFQLGQADRFRAGLIRSGTWRSYIYDVLEENGVPRELAALPHVESSFDPTAYSKAGAAGMWQFTRGTGLRYMRIDHIVDERRDPFLSTNAAARLLRDNYEVLGHWPLAITAYNHGLGGMRRAVSELGTTDIGVIVQKYKGRTFGFASRNFYAAFLAAVDIDANPEKYFGPLQISAPSPTIATAVPDYVSAQSLARALGINVGQLRQLNPALSEMVWSGDKLVPRGFTLRLPREVGATDPTVLFAAVPASERFAAQRPDVQHVVSRGETLSQIASRYRVSLASLVQINNLRNSHMIRAGQVLMLPVPAGEAPALAEANVGVALADGEYVVRPGDTIAKIARNLDVDPDRLLAENGIRDRNRIYAGQRLRIPGAALDAETPAAVLAAASGSDAVAVPAVLVADAARPDPAVLEQELDAVFEPEAAAANDADDEIAVALADAGDPVSAAAEGQAEDSGQNALASHQADLAADPSDYSVSNDTIVVQALETLGHYADWLEIRTQRLRDLNRMPFDRAVVIGQKLKLDFSRVPPEEFERRRLAYQQRRQEAFFSAYRIEDVEDHVIRSGESLWLLAQRRYNVPVWLLRQYNPDVDLDRVAPGTVVKFPKLKPISEGEAQVST